MQRNIQHRRATKRRASTLMEVTVSTVLVSTLMVTALRTSAFHTRNRQALAQDATAETLAHRLLAEIQTLRFAESSSTTTIGADTGESSSDRSTWDDVDDASGYNASPPKTRTNANRTELSGYREVVTVQHVSLTNLSASNSSTGLKKITVIVTPPTGSAASISALVADLPADDPRSGSQTAWSAIDLNGSSFLTTPAPACNLRNRPR